MRKSSLKLVFSSLAAPVDICKGTYGTIPLLSQLLCSLTGANPMQANHHKNVQAHFWWLWLVWAKLVHKKILEAY